MFDRKGEIETYGRKLTENESLYLILKSDYHHNVIRTAWEFLNIILIRCDLIKPGIT